MLYMKKKSGFGKARLVVASLALLLIAGGSYLGALVASPLSGPLTTMKPIDVQALPTPSKDANRIVIPKIGVNITYDTGSVALDRGAEWRYPDRGNPEKGGNFIIAAHRFSLQPTPTATIQKSPFYNIDKLGVGDKIVVDYNGKRYGYAVQEIKTVAPTAIEIEAPSGAAKLTLYSCSLDGAASDRVVLVSKPLGLVALDNNSDT